MYITPGVPVGYHDLCGVGYGGEGIGFMAVDR